MAPAADVLEFLRRCNVGEEALRCLDVLSVLMADLRDANRRLNLTRLTSADEFWVKHVADSLSIGLAFPAVFRAPVRLADVGCGPGFPALPLAWASTELLVTAIEAGIRKAEFVQSMIDKLDLRSCCVVARQVREVARLAGHVAAYDLVVLRAVGRGHALIRDCKRLLIPGRNSKIVFYTTPVGIGELRDRCRREALKHGLELSETDVFALPRDAGRRQFLVLTYP